MITRITKLPKHSGVLIGRDLNDVFEYGHVYEFRKIGGEIIVVDLGITALSNSPRSYPNENSTISAIMESSPQTYLVTDKEFNTYQMGNPNE